MNSSPFKSPAPSPRKEGETPPVHSTPLLSPDRGKDGSDLSLLGSPIESRKSGRPRKQTEKAAAFFNESLKQKKTLTSEEDSRSEAKSDPSPELTPCSSLLPNPPRKRGRPRKSDTVTVSPDVNSKHSTHCSTGSVPCIEDRSSGDPLEVEDVHTESSSENVSVGSTSLPRKRGRPRKSETVNPDLNSMHSAPKSSSCVPDIEDKSIGDPQEEVHTELTSGSMSVSATSLPRKRGRPRKSETPGQGRTVTGNAERSSSIVQSRGENRLCDVTDERSAAPSPAVPATAPTQPRKRGRPRKSETVHTLTDPPQEQPRTHVPDSVSDTPHIGSQEPKMASSYTETKENGENTCNTSSVEGASGMDASVYGGEIVVPEPPKRKRGRPRKQKPPAEDGQELQDLSQHKQDNSTEKTRTPRQRKITSFYYSEDDTEGDDDDDDEWERRPKNRKRTKKTTVDPERGEEEEEEKVVKKRRRKPRAKDPELGGEDDTSVAIEACLRCGQKMENLAAYKNHLVTSHAALYRKGCPEGEQTNAAIQQILNVRKVVHCPKCQKKFKFAQYFRHHLEWCGREDEKFQCALCGKWVKAMWRQHHSRDHRKQKASSLDAEKLKVTPGEKRKAATESMQKIKKVVEEALDGLDGNLEKREKRKRKNLDDDWDDDGLEEENDDDYDDDLDEENTKIYIRSLGKTADCFQEHCLFLEKLPKGELFPSLLPQRSQWAPLSESQSEKHLPKVRESKPVRIKQGKGTPTDYVKLQWGEAITDDKQSTAFVGGSVWSAEWCPFDEEVAPQVLAVSVGHEPWDSWMFNGQGQGPGHLQFWTAGHLDDRSGEVDPGLKPAFNIAHDCRYVLDMAWCPRRAYLSPPAQSADTFPRLGLLAVAGYHSHVLVYSIPTPDAIAGWLTERGEQKTSTPPTFKPTPALTLLCSDPDMCGACLSVAWQKRDNCDFIVGGYTKGFVEVWHLSTASPIVRVSESTLKSVRFFYACYGVYSVDWSWLDPTQFATATIENKVKVWDLKDTRTPLLIHPEVMVQERGPTRALSYGSSVLDAIIFCDEKRDLYSGAVYALDLSWGFLHGSDTKRIQSSLAKHSATVWDLSYSPWFNVVASGDTTGLMLLSSCQPVLFSCKKGITKIRRGVPVFFTRCKQILEGQQETAAAEVDSEEEEEDDKKKAFREDKTTSSEGLHFTFHDRDMADKKDFLNTGVEKSVCRSDIPGFKAADITSTAFNPNRRSSRWLACGTSAGFLRLLHLPCLAYEFHSARKFFLRDNPVLTTASFSQVENPTLTAFASLPQTNCPCP